MAAVINTRQMSVARAPCRWAKAVPRPVAGATLRSRVACAVAAAEMQILTREIQVTQQHQTALVTELTIDTWGFFMEEAAAGGHHVVVDFYTDWCGPCKLISPEVEKFAAEYEGVKFAKFNCGTNDKRFAIEKGIKALPTFHMYKDNEKLGEFVGAKPALLRKFVDQHVNNA